MEPPASLEPSEVAVARDEVLGHLCPVSAADVVLGQYEGYRATEGVDPDSTTEAFAALTIAFDTERWAGVPFLLRTGKALAESRQLVSVVFRPASQRCGFPEQRNCLSFDLAGDGSVGLRLLARRPSAHADSSLVPVELATSLSAVGPAPPRPPYVGLLSDALVGDRARFTRPDGLAHVWDAFAPLLGDPPPPTVYARGSEGPQAATALAEPLGWLRPGT